LIKVLILLRRALKLSISLKRKYSIFKD
jgi:hypothetical protein